MRLLDIPYQDTYTYIIRTHIHTCVHTYKHTYLGKDSLGIRRRTARCEAHSNSIGGEEVSAVFGESRPIEVFSAIQPFLLWSSSGGSGSRRRRVVVAVVVVLLSFQAMIV